MCGGRVGINSIAIELKVHFIFTFVISVIGPQMDKNMHTFKKEILLIQKVDYITGMNNIC